ncbi:hypothetical protein SASPL_133893 [Salvia splendens]|uniref:Cytochrome c-552/DMSO reductase-like haem-binding domain-containing protein n=1 Tax=Salvia splendens TaxID=180675 RepID=A0A8X8X5X7_SALSN|nr:hypothetical protein SASPL_133893 [Salvia splendens]
MLFLRHLLIGCLLVLAASHQESGEWTCEPDDEARISAQFRPGIVTIDGRADDWVDVDGFEFPLRPALDPDEDKQYKAGKMTVKMFTSCCKLPEIMYTPKGELPFSIHDPTACLFPFLLDYQSCSDDHMCPSVALMFQVGESATYHNMGGCKESPDTCNYTNCRDHEVDIMHFSIGNSIPGRLYGGNSINEEGKEDSVGLVDMFSWNPHCRNIDGSGPSGNSSAAQNDWRGAWWHSSFSTNTGYIEVDSPYGSSGQKGTYYFEFSRPLRTMDLLQRDAQFSIGQSSKFSAALWYPGDGNPWHGSAHYTVSCDWVAMDVVRGYSTHKEVGSWDAASAFAFVISVVALAVSIFVGYLLVSKSKSIDFTPIDRL